MPVPRVKSGRPCPPCTRASDTADLSGGAWRRALPGPFRQAQRLEQQRRVKGLAGSYGNEPKRPRHRPNPGQWPERWRSRVHARLGAAEEIEAVGPDSLLGPIRPGRRGAAHTNTTEPDFVPCREMANASLSLSCANGPVPHLAPTVPRPHITTDEPAVSLVETTYFSTLLERAIRTGRLELLRGRGRSDLHANAGARH